MISKFLPFSRKQFVTFSSFFREKSFNFGKIFKYAESDRINQDTSDIFISRANLTSASSLIFLFFPSSHIDTRADKCHNIESNIFIFFSSEISSIRSSVPFHFAKN